MCAAQAQSMRSETPLPSSAFRSPLPCLPDAVWHNVLDNLPLSSILPAALTTPLFSTYLASPHSTSLWRRLWDAHAAPLHTSAHIPSSSYRALLSKTLLLSSPPASTLHKTTPPTPSRATQIRVFPGGNIAIATTTGLTILTPCGATASYSTPSLGGIIRFADSPTPTTTLVATTSTSLLVLLTLDFIAAKTAHARSTASPARLRPPLRARPVRHRPLHDFSSAIGHVVSLVLSSDGRDVLLGFSNGHIRVVSLSHGTLVHVLTMRSPPDILAAAAGYVVASTSGARLGAAAWERTDGRALHRWDGGSPGWDAVGCVTGVAALKGGFVFWDGRGVARVVNLAQGGGWARVIEVRDGGGIAPLVGREKVLVLGDGRRCALGSSVGVVVVDCVDTGVVRRVGGMRVLDAPTALMAVGTDGKTLVTAEGDAFGGLASRFSRERGTGKGGQICVWDTVTGELKRVVEDVGCVVSLSVADNVVAVVGRPVRGVAADGETLMQGTAMVFRFDGLAKKDGDG